VSTTEQLEAAPLGSRAAAGLIDALLTIVGCGILFWIHLRFTGTVMPLWTIAGVAVAINVIPVWRFGASPGLALMALRVLRPESGKTGGIIELTARELIGRGVLALAYLIFVLLGIVWAAFGVGGISLRAGPALIIFVLAWIFFALAIAAQVMMFIRTDRRSIGDLIAKVAVVKAPEAARKPPEPAGEGELEADEVWEARARRNRTIGFVVLELLVVAAVVLAPFANLIRLDHSDVYAKVAARQDDYKIEGLRKQFEQNPASKKIAWDLIGRLRRRGEAEEAEAAEKRHRAARTESERLREKTLMAGFDKKPDDWGTLKLLLKLYEDQGGRVDDARKAWARYVQTTGTAQDRASFGLWLYDNARYQEAIDTMNAAAEAGWDTGQVHAYIGLSLWEQGKKQEARDALLLSIDKEPEIEDDVRGYIETLDRELGPRAPAPKAARR